MGMWEQHINDAAIFVSAVSPHVNSEPLLHYFTISL